MTDAVTLPGAEDEEPPSPAEIADKVRDVLRRAQKLDGNEKQFELEQLVADVREALVSHNTSAAESILAAAEVKLRSLETTTSTVEPVPAHTFRGRVASARRSLSGVIREHPFAADLCALGAIVAIWAGVLVWIQIQSYSSFRLLNDIAIFNQVLFTTSHSHSLLYYSKDLPGGNNGQFFSVHFSPFLFVLVPFYYFFPGIPTLLVLKQVALGLGALPAYALARAKLGSRAWGWFIAGVYLSTPLITGIDWANFDMESFIPLTLLSTFYFFEVGRVRWFIVSSIAALSLIESVAPLLALFGFMVLVGTLIPFSRRSLPRNRLVRKFAIWAVAAGIASLGVSYFFLTIVFRSPGGGALGSGFTEAFRTLGATSIPDIPVQVLLHPGNALAAVSFDGSSKVLYVLLLFGCVAFLPLLGDLKYLVPALAWICGIALLANGSVYFAFSNHTLAYPAPFLMAGAITGLRRLQVSGPRIVERVGLLTRVRSRWKPRWNPYVVGSILTAGLLVTVAVSSPWDAHPLGVPSGYPSGLEVPTAQDADLTHVLTYLPPSASVLTTSVIFPAVSARKAAFDLPGAGVPFLLNWTNNSASAGGALAFHRVTDWYLNMSSYVVLDFQLDLTNALAILYFGNNLTGYGVVAADQGAVLYERGWTSAPELWIPEQISLVAHQSTSNSSIYTTRANHGLPVGEYAATFWWADNQSAIQGTLKVTLKEVPVTVEAALKFQTATSAKYGLDLNLTNAPASSDKSTAAPNESIQFQLTFPESVSFSIAEAETIPSTLLAVVITQEMP